MSPIFLLLCTPAATNLLHDIDRAALAVVERVTAAQAAAGPGPLGQLAFEGEDQAVQPLLVPREVGGAGISLR